MQMTKEQRKEYLQRLACKEKTQEVVEEIIFHCKDLMFLYVHRFNMINDHMGYAAAEDGLIKAINSYNPDKAALFITYASVCIYNELGMLYRRNKGHNRCISTEEFIGEDLRVEDTLMSSDNIEDTCVSDSMVPIIERMALSEIDSVPSERHRNILTSWLDSGYTLSQMELAEKHGVSQSYVSQIISSFRRSLYLKLKSIGVVVK